MDYFFKWLEDLNLGKTPLIVFIFFKFMSFYIILNTLNNTHSYIRTYLNQPGLPARDHHHILHPLAYLSHTSYLLLSNFNLKNPTQIQIILAIHALIHTNTYISAKSYTILSYDSHLFHCFISSLLKKTYKIYIFVYFYTNNLYNFFFLMPLRS